MGLAREWREATRWAFDEAVKAGFFVRVLSFDSRTAGPGAYLLQRGTVSEVGYRAVGFRNVGKIKGSNRRALSESRA